MHPRPQPVPFWSPLRSRRHGALDREQDPGLPLDPKSSRKPAPELARPPRLESRQEPGPCLHSRPSKGMSGLCPTIRTRRGPASYSKGRLVPGPLAWGLERQRASGRHQPPTLAGDPGCPALSAPPLFGSWRKVNREVAPSGPGAPPPLAFSVTRPPPPRYHCGICLVTPSPSPPPLLSPGLCR